MGLNVIPANAGIQVHGGLDPRVRGDDKKAIILRISLIS